MKNLEDYFSPFRKQIIGINHEYESPYGKQKFFMATGLPVAGFLGRLSKPLVALLALL